MENGAQYLQAHPLNLPDVFPLLSGNLDRRCRRTPSMRFSYFCLQSRLCLPTKINKSVPCPCPVPFSQCFSKIPATDASSRKGLGENVVWFR